MRRVGRLQRCPRLRRRVVSPYLRAADCTDNCNDSIPDQGCRGSNVDYCGRLIVIFGGPCLAYSTGGRHTLLSVLILRMLRNMSASWRCCWRCEVPGLIKNLPRETDALRRQLLHPSLASTFFCCTVHRHGTENMFIDCVSKLCVDVAISQDVRSGDAAICSYPHRRPQNPSGDTATKELPTACIVYVIFALTS